MVVQLTKWMPIDSYPLHEIFLDLVPVSGSTTPIILQTVNDAEILKFTCSGTD